MHPWGGGQPAPARSQIGLESRQRSLTKTLEVGHNMHLIGPFKVILVPKRALGCWSSRCRTAILDGWSSAAHQAFPLGMAMNALQRCSDCEAHSTAANHGSVSQTDGARPTSARRSGPRSHPQNGCGGRSRASGNGGGGGRNGSGVVPLLSLLPRLPHGLPCHLSSLCAPLASFVAPNGGLGGGAVLKHLIPCPFLGISERGWGGVGVRGVVCCTGEQAPPLVVGQNSAVLGF